MKLEKKEERGHPLRGTCQDERLPRLRKLLFSYRYCRWVKHIVTFAEISLGFRCQSLLHQSPIRIWVLLEKPFLCSTLSAQSGPENLRLHAMSKWFFTALMVVSQPLDGSRHGQ